MGTQQQAPTAHPMVRVISGAICTLVAYAVDPSLGLAVAVTSGVWVLLGIGRLVGRVAERPAEHNVQVRGAVAHVVVDPNAARPFAPQPMQFAPPRPLPQPSIPPPRRDGFIECPECTLFLATATQCVCGWTMPPELPPAGAQPAPEAFAPPTYPPTSAPVARPRLSPACPQCRAPTQWMAEFGRFFCARCDAYVET